MPPASGRCSSHLDRERSLAVGQAPGTGWQQRSRRRRFSITAKVGWSHPEPAFLLQGRMLTQPGTRPRASPRPQQGGMLRSGITEEVNPSAGGVPKEGREGVSARRCSPGRTCSLSPKGRAQCAHRCPLTSAPPSHTSTLCMPQLMQGGVGEDHLLRDPGLGRRHNRASTSVNAWVAWS